MRIEIKTWGGRRSGAGRKRIHSKGVAHRTREKVNHKTPMHINFKFRTQIKNKTSLKLLKKAIVNARRQGLKINHFSMQHNHIHLIVEANNNSFLTRGMRSLTITFAKGLNMGKVQIERYHLHVLKTVSETKNAVKYVLFNKQRHEKGRYSVVDSYCSIMNMKNYPKLISDYAKKRRMTLKMELGEGWMGDCPCSCLLKRAINLLQTG